MINFECKHCDVNLDNIYDVKKSFCINCGMQKKELEESCSNCGLSFNL